MFDLKEDMKMALFGFGKKKEETKEASCCCGGSCDAETMAQAENAKKEGSSVKVLGAAVLSAMNWKRTQWKLWQNWEWIPRLTM